MHTFSKIRNLEMSLPLRKHSLVSLDSAFYYGKILGLKNITWLFSVLDRSILGDGSLGYRWFPKKNDNINNF